MSGQYVATFVDVTDMESNVIGRVFHEYEWVEDQPWPEHWWDVDDNGDRISAREYIRRAHPEFHEKMIIDLCGGEQ